MTQKEDLDLEIDRYIDGLMDITERTAFEEGLANDSELQSEVNLRRSVIKAVRMEQLESIIKNKEASIARKGKIRRMVISFSSLAAAACIAGFFYVGYLNNCETLANRYYSSYDYSPLPSRGGEATPLAESDSIFLSAMGYLNGRTEYDNVKRFDGKDKMEWNVSNKELKKSIGILESLNEKPAGLFAVDELDVKWYLSLAYLKNGQKKKARTLLKEIADKANSEYQLKAKELLKEL